MSTLLSRMELSTIVEGQALGTVHIMEDRVPDYVYRYRYSYTYTYTYTYMYTCIYVYVCVFVFFFLLCGAVGGGVGWVGWSGVCRGVVWCGVSGAKVAEQIV